MKNLIDLIDGLKKDEYISELGKLYRSGNELEYQRDRLVRVAEAFASLFGSDREVSVFSAPGRTEVGGNHTDHNHGKVLAASINLDAVCVASPSDDNMVNVKSEKYQMDSINLNELTPHPAEFGRSRSLVRGVCAGFVNRGYKVGGFDATTASDVLSGSGLSSSAAFEVLLGTTINYLFNDGKVSAVEIACIAQYAENVFFNKPCGLMDQTASSVGGFVAIDFNDPSAPIINKVDFDFNSCGHSLCITDTGGSHSDLTGEYAAVREEMESVAAAMGKSVLREVPYDDLMNNLPAIKQKLGDRAILRAIHFYNENKRVDSEISALNSGDFDRFKELVVESGNSSYMYNQNVFTCRDSAVQPVSVALALSEELLRGRGAWRVHGGGFAGTIQAFVPNDLLEKYIKVIEAVFGGGSCHVLSIRADGGTKII